MCDTKINVETIGYYHRDRHLKVTADLLPKKLNENRKYFENPSENPLPPINLNIDVKDSGAGEYKMESLLDYIRQKGWPNNNPPEFVTNRHLLKTVAAPRQQELLTVVGVRRNRVIYLLKISREESYNKNFGAVFEHFLTKENEDEEISEDGIVRKAVFLANVPKESGECSSVLYSGETDAIDDDGNHFELKVLSSGMTTLFWNIICYQTFWQAALGNVKTVVIGSRTGKSYGLQARNLPQYSLYKMETIPRQWLLSYWKIRDGEQRISTLLEYVKSVLTSDGEAFVFTRLGFSTQWRHRANQKDTDAFRKTLDTYLGD